jgi:Plavaka transposase
LIPERAGVWKTTKLSFNERPDKSFTLRYRDPVEAVKTLWKDPQLSPEMVFAGQKIFSDKTMKNRIFTEIYNAKWWHILQVKILPTGPFFPVLMYA